MTAAYPKEGGRETGWLEGEEEYVYMRVEAVSVGLSVALEGKGRRTMNVEEREDKAQSDAASHSLAERERGTEPKQ